MSIDLVSPPGDLETLHQVIGELLREHEVERVEVGADIDRLRRMLRTLQRMQY